MLSSSLRGFYGFILSGGAFLRLIGCESALQGTSGPPRACTEEARPAISATEQNHRTGAYIGSGTTLTLKDGAFADSVTFPAGQSNLDARALPTPRTYERPGTYQVRVRRAPYADLVVFPVVVQHGGCHVQTFFLLARRLLPLGG